MSDQVVFNIQDLREVPDGTVVILNNGRYAELAPDSHYTALDQREVKFFGLRGRIAIDQADLPARVL